MARILNLTPHAVKIVDENGVIQTTYEPTGTVARATQQAEKIGELDGVEVVSMKFGETVDLPEYEQGTLYIVSIITLNAAQANGRQIGDLLLTTDLVRDEAGSIIGCRRLVSQDANGFYQAKACQCGGCCGTCCGRHCHCCV